MLLLNKISLDDKTIITIILSLFSTWLFTLPLTGEVFAAIAAKTNLKENFLFFLTLFTFGVGLTTSALFTRKHPPKKSSLSFVLGSCLGGNFLLFWPLSWLGPFVLLLISFMAGGFLGWLGFYLKEAATTKERNRIFLFALGCSQLLALLPLSLDRAWDFRPGFASFFLIPCILFLVKLKQPWQNQDPTPLEKEKTKEFLPLFITFVLLISLNKGFYFKIVKPSFLKLGPLTNFYGRSLYILALAILHTLPRKINRGYLFYFALSVLGISWLLFLWLSPSIISYLLVESTMQGSFAAFDLFLFCILGSIFDYSKNPAHVFGMGLALHVFGALLGIITSQFLSSAFSTTIAGAFGLLLVFAGILLFPPLDLKLVAFLKQHLFLVKIRRLSPGNREKALLTEKEQQIVELLLQGYTYRAIAESLYISENTLKYHTKNIYRKLKVKNRMELVNIFAS